MRGHPFLSPEQVAQREAELSAMPLTRRQKEQARELLRAALDGALVIRRDEAKARLHTAAPNWAARLDGMAVSRLLSALGYRRFYGDSGRGPIEYRFSGGR